MSKAEILQEIYSSRDDKGMFINPEKLADALYELLEDDKRIESNEKYLDGYSRWIMVNFTDFLPPEILDKINAYGDYKCYYNCKTKKEAIEKAKRDYALEIMENISDDLNDDWLPDFEFVGKERYLIIRDIKKYEIVRTYQNLYAITCYFKSRNLAEECREIMTDFYDVNLLNWLFGIDNE